MVQSAIKGSQGNQQFLPKLIDNILNVSKTIPLQTAVLVALFGVQVTASTTASEANFNNLKNRIFKKVDLTKCLDDSLITYIPALSGQIELMRKVQDAPSCTETSKINNALFGIQSEIVDKDSPKCYSCSNMSKEEQHRRIASTDIEN